VSFMTDREGEKRGSSFVVLGKRQPEPSQSMIIVVYLGANIKEYRDRYFPRIAKGSAEELVERECPACTVEGMHRHGYRSRRLVVPEGTGYKLEVLRMYCPDCGATHTQLPHFVLPYHTYAARTVMGALRLYAMYGSFHVVKRLMEAVKSRALLRQWVQRFTEVLRELIKGCQRFLVELGVFVPSSSGTIISSGRDPPLAGALDAFADATHQLRDFLTERLSSPILPDSEEGELGWVHLILFRTGQLTL